MISSIVPGLAIVVVTSLDAALSNQKLNVSEMFTCNHEEANTRLFLQVKHAKSDAIIKTVDTDVVIIAIFCFKLLEINKLWIEFEVAGNTCYIPIHAIVSSLPQSQTMCASLPFSMSLLVVIRYPRSLALEKKLGIVGCFNFLNFVTSLPLWIIQARLIKSLQHKSLR